MSQNDNVALQAGCEFFFTFTPSGIVATAASSTVEQTFTLSGAAPKLFATDTIYIQDNLGPTNSVTITHARAIAPNQLVLAFNNPTAGSLTYPTHALVVAVLRLPVGTPAV
jgi:hypothetical protein